MSAAVHTKIFGLKIGVDPKILVGGLIVVAVALFWYNSRSDDEDTGGTTASAHRAAAPASTTAKPRATAARRSTNTGDRGTLRLRPIDATRGDVDPTLRLDLLTRLRALPPEEGGRNLFELGPAPPTAAELAKKAPIITPQPLPVHPASAARVAPAFNIPLKYYGFVKSSDKAETNRGLFLDGDNVLVGSEGQVLMQRYMVVELTAASARLEDVQAKQGETLSVVPVALP